MYKDLERGAGAPQARRSERNVPGNEGVGEHVRTRFQPGFGPGEIAEQRIPHRTKKTCFFCRTGFGKSELSRKYDPAV